MSPRALRVSSRRICSGCRRNADFGLHVDLIGAAEAVEVVDVERAEVDLQRVEDVVERHAVGLDALAIDVGVDLRHVDLEAREQAGELGSLVALRRCCSARSPYSSSKPALARSSTYSLKPPTCPSPCTGGGGKIATNASWMLAKLRVQVADDRAGADSSGACRSSDGLSIDEHDAGVRRVDEAVDRQPGKRDRVRDARMLERDRRHPPDDGLGAIERRRVRQLRERHQVVLVLRRHEAGRHAREADERSGRSGRRRARWRAR